MTVRTPNFNLSLGSVDFSDRGKKKYVQSIEVDQTSDGPSSFKIILDDSDNTFSEGGSCKIREGDACQIELGFVETKVKKVIEGLVTGVKANRKEYSRMLYEITGFDGLQALTRGRHRRSWENIKISDIVSTIAGECSLSADCDDTGSPVPYVVQNNLTNLAFLQERAKRIGFEVKVEERRLVFKKPKKTDSNLTLCWHYRSNTDECLLQRCDFDTTTMNVVNKVVVRWYDEKAAKPIVAEATAGGGGGGGGGGGLLAGILGGKMGGEADAGERASSNNPETTIQISDTPVYSQEEAETLANSVLNQRADNYLTGKGSCEGNAGLKCGVMVKIRDIGKEMDGEYYITKAKHVLKVGNGQGYGYWTQFEVSRSGR